MKKIVSLLLLPVILASILTSCNKKPPDAPELPPEESMLIDFSNFESGKKSADFLTISKGVENSNWEFSALVAGTWKALIVTTLAVPVAAFKLSIDQTPTYLENNVFQWSFNVSVASVTYKARLTGEIKTSDVQWKMYITKEGTGGFAEFLWFEGTSKLDGTSGQWTLNHSSTYQEPVLQIDWTKSSSSLGTVKYTYVREKNDSRVADPFKTSYIEYGKTSSTTFDAYYNIKYYSLTLQAFSTVKVEWSTTGHNGRVQCAEYFGNANWYCWNSNLVNITCP
jgi:hypothetical protein